jgi:hypothetical protein
LNEKLKATRPSASLFILENMNHIFREIEGNSLENSKSYNEAHRPLHPELIQIISGFVKNLK